jgi:hypothetical protein
LNQYEVEGDSFLDRIITGDETWRHHYEPEYELWNSGPHLLVQIFRTAARRLLFIAGESA